jgi:hypothetical protein
MSQQPWPIVYRFQDQDWLLRAPLGMYMLPALAGKLGGISFAAFALLAQNTIIFSLIFYFLIPAGSTIRTSLIMIGVFCIFSGWDIIGAGLKYIFAGVLPPTTHIEPWAGLFQYSSHITQLFWVPNHTIPGWLFACLYLRWLRGQTSLGLVLAAVPLLAFWSPLAAMGMIPFAAYAGLSSLFKKQLTVSDIAMVSAAIIAALPMLFYERLNAQSVLHGFLLNAPLFWFLYPLFISLEVLPFLALIAAANWHAIRDWTFLITAAVLLLIPFYRIGVANDFSMRASIPALAILAVFVGTKCAMTRGRPVWGGFAIACLAIGSVTGLLEISRALTQSRIPVSGCDLVQVWQLNDPEKPLTHYLAPIETVPKWAIAPFATAIPAAATEACPSKA